MNAKTALSLLFVAIFLAMLSVTVIASLDRSVFEAGDEIWNDPWARATLFDAYFAFITVYLWIAWRERTVAARLVWLILILSLGSFAIAAYVLLALRDCRAGQGIDPLFRHREAS